MRCKCFPSDHEHDCDLLEALTQSDARATALATDRDRLVEEARRLRGEVEAARADTRLQDARDRWRECQMRLAQYERLAQEAAGVESDIASCIATLRERAERAEAEVADWKQRAERYWNGQTVAETEVARLSASPPVTDPRAPKPVYVDAAVPKDTRKEVKHRPCIAFECCDGSVCEVCGEYWPCPASKRLTT